MAKRLKKAEIVYKGCFVEGDVVEERVTQYELKAADGTTVARLPVKHAVLVRKLVPVLVTLRLPVGARVNHWPADVDAKVRADKAEVIKIEDKAGKRYGEAFAKRYHGFKYFAGETVLPHNFDKTRTECSGGIHFFRGTKEAWAWVRG